jgi:hypothetical protein
MPRVDKEDIKGKERGDGSKNGWSVPEEDRSRITRLVYPV